MDAFELLKADHRKVAKLFDRIDTAHGKTKLKIFERIKKELDLHTHIEEKIFYPALEKPGPTHDLTLEAYEEHEVVKTLLAELSSSTNPNDEWDAKATVLRENIEHHVEEEEGELFDKADAVLSDEQLETLGSRMAAEKARKQGRQAPKKTNRGSKERGIVSKIVNFVGLDGGNSAKKSRSRKLSPASKTGGQSARKASNTSRTKSTASRPKATALASKRVARRGRADA